MNCRDFEAIITTVAREQMHNEMTGGLGLAHTGSCKRCATRLEEERALLAGVQAVVEEIAGERAPVRVEAALLLAFHERTVSGRGVLRMPQKNYRPRWMWATAAAVLALVCTIVVVWLQARPFNEHNVEPEVGSAPPAPAASPRDQILSTDDSKSQVPSGRRRGQAGRRATPPDEQDGIEIATDFMPLIDGDDLDSLDDNQLVRVELPGSALIAVGLPVDAEMANAPVKADVLLRHDGLARAIRFVR